MKRGVLVALVLVAFVAAPLVLGDGTQLVHLVVERFVQPSFPAPPSIRLASPLQGDGVARAVHVAGSANAGDLQHPVTDVEFRVDDAAWQSAPGPSVRGAPVAPFAFDLSLANGDHVVEVRATDGDATSLVARATVRASDVSPPATRILSPQDGSSAPDGALSVSGVTSAPASTVLVAIDSSNETPAAVQGATWTVSLPVTPGLHVVSARADDGLPTRVTVSVGNGSTPPTLLVASPAQPASFGSTGSADCDHSCIRFSGLATGDVASVLVSLDGGAPRLVNATVDGTATPTPGGMLWSWNLTTTVPGADPRTSGLPTGEHVVTFVANSSAGESSAPRTVELNVHTARMLAVSGDATPRFTGTPLSFVVDGASSNITWLLDGTALPVHISSVTTSLATPGDHVLEAVVDAPPGIARLPLYAIDRAPVVSGGALAAPAGDDSFFGARASDADGTIVSYVWSFADGASATTSTSNTTHAYAHPGTFAASVTVIDDQGVPSDPFPFAVDVPNHPPIANFTFSPTEPSTLDRVEFRDLSSDPDGSITSASWDLGEPGAAATGDDMSYTFRTRGDHVVALVVQDDSGAVDTATQVVHVANVPPVAAFAFLPESPQTGENVTFVDASSKLGEGAVVQWIWDFADGTREAGPNATHAFAHAGRYTVTLHVKDDWGDSDTTRTDIIVRDSAPDVRAIDADPPTPLALDPVRFTASSFDHDSSVTNISWDFGDGSTSNESSPVHRFGHSGTYNVTASATDASGLSGSLTFPLVVGNAPPTVEFGGASSVFAGVPVTVRANASDVDGRVVLYAFDMDGDGRADCVTSEPSCTFTYGYDGTWPVWINVTDDEGAHASAFHLLDVSPPPSGLAPPRVRVDAPEPDAVLRGSYLVRGAASGIAGNVTDIEVQMRNGSWIFSSSQGAWAQADGTDLWSILLDTRAFPDGPLELIVRATDERGGLSEVRVPVTVDNERDTDAPQVDVHVTLSPGQQLLNDTLVRVFAAHPGGVQSVRWRVDDGEWQDAAGNGFAWAVPLTIRGLEPGNHTLTVDAWHGVTDHAEASVAFVLAGQIPTLIVDVTPGPVAYGIAHADGHVSDGANVLYRFDNGLWHLATGSATWRFDATTTEYDEGPHVVTIKAVDPILGFESPPQRYLITVTNDHVTSGAPKTQSNGHASVRGVPSAPLWGALLAVSAFAGARRRRRG